MNKMKLTILWFGWMARQWKLRGMGWTNAAKHQLLTEISKGWDRHLERGMTVSEHDEGIKIQFDVFADPEWGDNFFERYVRAYLVNEWARELEMEDFPATA